MSRPNRSAMNGELVNLPRPTAVTTRAEDLMAWEATHLRVRDLATSLRFWRDLIGLRVTEERDEAVSLGVTDAELIVLSAGARQPFPHGHTGLYHVALHLPSARDFAEMFVRLRRRGVDPRPTDHLMHWAMYLTDPDGIGLELSFETADRFDHVIPGSRMRALGADGREYGVVEPLDIATILAAFPDLRTDMEMPAGTRVGHNHLHVADIAVASEFYARLGFGANPAFAGMADFHAHGSFQHRLAVNIWQGRGAPPAPLEAAGLEHVRLRYATPAAYSRVLADLDPASRREHDSGDGHAVSDPSGNLLLLSGPAG